MNLRLYILFIVGLIPLQAHSQYTTHTLNGTVHIKDQGDYKYKVVFSIVGTLVVGHSTTWLSYPGMNEMTTPIKGSINTAKHTLRFTELKPDHPLPSSCYFDVSLTWQPVDHRFSFTGPFTAHDDKGRLCDEGTVYLQLDIDSDPIFEIKNTAHKDTLQIKKNIPHTIVSRESSVAMADTNRAGRAAPQNDTAKVTATVQKEFYWRSDTCILDIWDGEVVDGDIITILFNGDKVLERYSLIKNKKRLFLPMRPKENKLQVIAENEGEAPPNTAQILITDGSLSYSILSILHTGDTATIILKKKK